MAQAKRRNATIDAAVFDFIRDVLLLEAPPDLDEAGRHERDLFVGRFQQVTSPVMAKGIEDTAFYRYLPLASLNEVGGDPAAAPLRLRNFIATIAFGKPTGRSRSRVAARTTPSAARTPAQDRRSLRNPAPVAQGGQSLGALEPAAPR